MQSKAATVAQYLSELPDERRRAIEAVRKVILDNLDDGYEEGMQYGMIGFYVPHSLYPAGYHCDPRQPLPFACLASQKNYMSLYMMTLYGGGDLGKWFQTEWAKTGKKLDMGKSCIRFRKLDDLALDVIGEVIRRIPMKVYIQHYETAIGSPSARASKQPARSTPTKRKAGKKHATTPSRARKRT